MLRKTRSAPRVACRVIERHYSSRLKVRFNLVRANGDEENTNWGGKCWKCVLQQSLKIWLGIYMLGNDTYKLGWEAWKIQGLQIVTSQTKRPNEHPGVLSYHAAWMLRFVLQGLLKPHHETDTILGFHCPRLWNAAAALNLTRMLLILCCCWADCDRQRHWRLCAVSGKYCKGLKAVCLWKALPFCFVFSPASSSQSGLVQEGLLSWVSLYISLHSSEWCLQNSCRIARFCVSFLGASCNKKGDLHCSTAEAAA